MTTLGLTPAIRTTPKSLCSNCVYSRFVRGYKLEEELVTCGYTYPPREVPFPVRECTDFREQRKVRA
jgi:hypothetical protein